MTARAQMITITVESVSLWVGSTCLSVHGLHQVVVNVQATVVFWWVPGQPTPVLVDILHLQWTLRSGRSICDQHNMHTYSSTTSSIIHDTHRLHGYLTMWTYATMQQLWTYWNWQKIQYSYDLSRIGLESILRFCKCPVQSKRIIKHFGFLKGISWESPWMEQIC